MITSVVLQPELPFIVTLLLLLLCARFIGEIFERFKQPAIIGEILAGVVLGPSVFGIVHFTNEIKVLSDLGVFLLIVLAGMEIKPEDVRNSVRGKSFFIAVLGFLIPMISGILIGIVLNLGLLLTLFISLCISITALPVSVRILMDLGKLHTDIGRKIISAAIFNDVISLMILGIILDSRAAQSDISTLILSVILTTVKVGLFVALMFAAYKVFKITAARIPVVQSRVGRILGFLKGKESLFAVIIVFVLVFANVSEVLGLHFVIGAFFGAMLINRDFLGIHNFEKVKSTTSGITMGFLAPIFFASMGVQFDILSIDNLWLLVLVLLASFLSKIIGGYYGGRLAGLNKAESFTLGIGLNARGIMELVIANIALQNGIINTSVYSILVLMGILTTLTSPILLRKCFERLDNKLLLTTD